MGEYIDPPLKLSVEGLRWMGEEFESVGEGMAGLTLHGTDSDEDSIAVLRLLRKIGARRLWMALAVTSINQDALDFESPNAPTEKDLKELVGHIERALEAARFLVQLAPEIDTDDES